jgi:hypothetical protein
MIPSTIRASRPLIVPLLLVFALVLLSTIYLVHVRTPARLRYFTDSRLRALIVLGEQLEGALQGRTDAVLGATWRGQNGWQGAVGEVQDLQPVEPKRCRGPEAIAPQGGIYVERNSEPALGGAHLRSTARTEWGVLPAGNVSVQRPSAVLYFRADPPAEAKPRRVAVCAKSQLARIVEPFIAGSAVHGFEVFVADAQGHVLFARGPVGWGLTRLPSASESAAAADAGRTGATPADEAKAGTTEGPPAIERLMRGSTVHNVMVGETPYKLLAQPVRVPRVISSRTDDNLLPADSVWVVGMFVPVEVLTAEARTVSVGSWTHLPLLVILILLTIPAVKIACMGPREPLTASTMRALILCAVTGAGMASGLLLGHLSSGWLEATLDSELALLSKKVQTNFVEEVQHAYDTVDRFRTERGTPRAHELLAAREHHSALKTTAPQCSGAPREGWRKWLETSCSLTHMLTHPTPSCPAYSDNADHPEASENRCKRAAADRNLCEQVTPENNLCEQVTPENNLCEQVTKVTSRLKYRYVEMLILTDQCGWQREKWTAKEGITTLIHVGEYNAFRDVLSGRLWQVPGRGEAVLHLQQSPNTALFVRTLALPIWDTDRPYLLGVAVGVPELMSMTPVLPPGFGIAVIQGDGRVVFHSQERRNLYENFLTENTGFRHIEAAAAARRARFLTSDYHGRTHRLYVHPLASSPWTLIVYRDMELPRTLDLTITGAWLVLFLLYSGGLTALWMLIRLFAGADDGTWIWPNPQRGRAYWSVVGLLAAVALASGLAIVWGPEAGLARLLVGTCAPLAALTLTFLILAPPIKGHPAYDHCGRTRRRWRAAAWMGLALSAAGLALAVLLSPDWVAGVLLGCLIATSVGIWFSWFDATHRFLWAAPDTDAAWRGPARTSHWEVGYAFAGLALLLVVGVLPSVAIYKDAFDLGLSAFIHQGQRGLGLALAEREDKVRQRYNARDGWPKDLWQDRLQETWDLPPAGFFGDGCWPTRNWCPEVPSHAEEKQHETEQPWKDSYRLAARHVSGLAMAWLPVYHRESGQLREFLFDRASDDRWHVEENSITLHDPRLIGPMTAQPGRIRLQRAHLSTWPVMLPPMLLGVILLLMGLAGAAGYALIRWYARRLFDIDHCLDTDGGGSGTWLATQGLLLLHPTAGVRATLDARVSQGAVGLTGLQRPACRIDLQAAREQWKTDDGCGLVVVDHLEHRVDDSEFNRAKLALLEHLVLGQNCHVVVLSTIDPVQYFWDRLQSPGDEKADERYVTAEEIDRWAAVMERLVQVAVPLGGAPAEAEDHIVEWIECPVSARTPKLPACATQKEWQDEVDAACKPAPQSRLEQWQSALKAECQWTPRLRGMALDAIVLLAPPDDPLGRIGDLAHAHYRTVWSTLTDRQRLVLIHLARNGFVNPNSRTWPVVRHLAEQGLLRRTPAPRLMNKTFARFVEQVETEEQVRKWERAAGMSTWNRIRNAFMVASILLAVFLFQTQPQLLTSISGILAAAVGLTATVSNLLGFFPGRRVPSPPPQESAPS